MIFSMYLLIFTVLFLWIYILWRRRNFYKLMFKLPGPIGWPIVGQVHELLKREEILKTFDQQEQKYGKIVYTWLGPFPFILVTDPQITQDIYTTYDCINKSHIYKSGADAIGLGLITSNNPRWSKHRKLMNPAFGLKSLISFMPIFNKNTNILLNTFDMLVEKKTQIDLFPIMQEFTLNISIQNTFGTSILDKKALLYGKVTTAYQLILNDITEMSFYPWLSFKFVRQLLGKEAAYAKRKRTIRQFIQNLIDDKLKNTTEVTDGPKNPFINLTIEHLKNGHMSMEGVEDELNILVFAGFETTAATVTHTLIMLAMFPEYQQRAYEEICTILPERGVCDISYDDIQKMVYLDMAINETMRLIAPVPVMLRKTTAEVTLSNGVTLPEGLQIAIDIYNMQRSKDLWGPEAHIYNPDKFLPSNLEHIHPYSFIPFTKGLRSCIGTKYAYMSMKVILAKLIRNYHFQTDYKFDNLHFIEDISIKLKEHPLFQIRKRNS